MPPANLPLPLLPLPSPLPRYSRRKKEEVERSTVIELKGLPSQVSGNLRPTGDGKGVMSEDGKVVAARSPLLKRQQTGNSFGVGKQAGDYDVRLTQDGYWRR